MKKAVFYGSSAAVVTPFCKSGEIDYDAFSRIVEWQIQQGTQAITVLGTTGENPTVSDSEFERLVSLAVKTARKRVPVVAGTGRNDTAHSAALSQTASALGADALLVVSPYYNKTTQSGLIAHTEKIASSTPLPVILYNVPQRTGMSFSADTYKQLSQHPNVYGVKEASGNFNLILQTLDRCPSDFYIYSGNDDQNVAIISMGGAGAISVLANVMPKKAQEICSLALAQRSKEAATELASLSSLLDALFCEVNPIPVKAALAAMGMCDEYLRLPLVEMSEANKKELFAQLRKNKLI